MKRRPDHNPALFPVILAIVVCFPAISCQQNPPYDVCGASVQCGNIPVEYPFWGFDRPAYCGHPGFQLTCQSDVPVLRYQSLYYRVLDIDTSTQTITIARNDLWTTNCPQPLYNTTYNSTLFNDDNLRQRDVSLYYNCDTTVPGIPSLGNNYQFSCDVNDTQSDGYFYRTDMIVPNMANFLVQCENHIDVPVNQASAARLAAPAATTDDLRSVLTAGFNLTWSANYNECSSCIQSNGQCGSNSTSPDLFVCYCANGNFSSTCNGSSGGGGGSSNKSLSTILPIVGAIVAAIGIGIGIFICRQRGKRIVIKKLSPTKTETKAILTVSSNMVNSDTSNFTASIPSYPSSKTTNDYGKSSYFGAQVFSYEELEVATDHFNDSRELGDGGFGAVYYGNTLSVAK